MTSYYVYVYWDSRETPEIPIYVGKGHGDRAHGHLRWTHNPYLRAKLRKIRAAGLTPRIQIHAQGLTSPEASALEMVLILKYGRADLQTGTLCNFTNGGEGCPGRVPSAKTRRLWSRQRTRPQTPAQYLANCARRHRDETKQKMSTANKGRKPSPQTVEATREYNRTRPITEDMRQRWSVTRKAMGLSPEHQTRMREGKRKAAASRTPEEEQTLRERRANANLGSKRSEETKRKMREAWERRRQVCGKPGSSTEGEQS